MDALPFLEEVERRIHVRSGVVAKALQDADR